MNVDIAERLAKRRRDAGYSQEALAEKLGVTRQAVSKWERSESSPDTDNLIALARLYQVSLDELLNFDPAIADDVDFEAADRAREQIPPGAGAAGTANAASAADAGPGGSAGNATTDHDWQFDDDSYVVINPLDGVHVKDGKSGEEVHVGWSGISVKPGSGTEGWQGNWQDLEDTISDWDERLGGSYGSSSLNAEDEGRRRLRRLWNRFPFPLVAIIAYLLLGFFAPAIEFGKGFFDAWEYGCFLVATIPLYYMLVNAITRRQLIRFIEGLWPLACVTGFIWMWLFEGIPHPTWVVFLTIPLVEWVCETIRKSRRRSQNELEEAKFSASSPLEGNGDKTAI